MSKRPWSFRVISEWDGDRPETMTDGERIRSLGIILSVWALWIGSTIGIIGSILAVGGWPAAAVLCGIAAAAAAPFAVARLILRPHSRPKSPRSRS